MTNPEKQEIQAATTGSVSPFIIKVKKNADKWHIETNTEDLDSRTAATTTTVSVVKMEVDDTAFNKPPDQTEIILAATPISQKISSRPLQKLRQTSDQILSAETTRNAQEAMGSGTDKRLYSCNLCPFYSVYLLGFLNHITKTHYTRKITSQQGLHYTPLSCAKSSDESMQELTHGNLSADLFNSPSQMLKNDAELPLPINATNNDNEGTESNMNVDSPCRQTEVSEGMPVMIEYHSKNASAVENTMQAVPVVTPTVSPRDSAIDQKPFVDLENNAKKTIPTNESENYIEKLGSLKVPITPETHTASSEQPSCSILDKSSSSNSSGQSICSPRVGKASRGAKLNNIVDNLKECRPTITAVPTSFSTPPHSQLPKNIDQTVRVCSNCGNQKVGQDQCNFCLHEYPQVGSRCPNAKVQIFQKPNNGIEYLSNGGHAAFSHSVPQSYTQDRAIFSPSNQYKAGFADIGHGPQHSNQSGHFEDLQALMRSGRVTMPDPAVLQSINCSQDKWNHIQEILHEAFSAFPYLTRQESQSLARTTGLRPKQVNTLFAVARLQHGISWEQHEIDSARRSLSSIGGNRTQSQLAQQPCPVNIQMQSPPLALKQIFQHFTKEQHDILRWSFTSIPLTINELNRLHEVTELDKSTILHYFKQLNVQMSPTGAEPPSANNNTPQPSNLLLTGGGDDKINRSYNPQNKSLAQCRPVLNHTT